MNRFYLQKIARSNFKNGVGYFFASEQTHFALCDFFDYNHDKGGIASEWERRTQTVEKFNLYI